MSSYEVYGTPVELFWHKAINLVDVDYNRKHELISNIPNSYGIYIFHRRFGEYGEALYIGKASNLKRRIYQELDARGIIEHVKNSKKGMKLLSFAEIIVHGNCDKEKRIEDIESAIIEISMYREGSLFNTKKTKVHLQ